jgi:Ca2+-binding RTX toxin-like protein
MPRPRLLAGSAVVILALAAAAPAGASTVTLTHDAELDYTLSYQAAPGERNDVNVASLGALASGGWLVYDAAPLTAAAGCTSLDAHTASCPVTETETNLEVRVDLGDGDDMASVAGACGAAEIPEDFACHPATVTGGSGNDVIYGADVHPDNAAPGSILDGGEGDDAVFAGRAAAWITGGPGDDALLGSPAADRMSGGDGLDRISGYGGNDRGWGGAGSDRVDGGRGNDTLSGGGGRDTLLGSTGNDTFYAFDHWRDSIDGGRGSDRATVDGGRDRTTSVERVRRR